MSGFWKQLFPATSPSARGDVQMVLDESTSDVLLFGGADGSGFLWETWKWDGSTWTELFPATTPTPGGGNTLYQNDLGWDGVNSRPMYVAKESGGVGYRFWYYDWGTPDWVEIFPATVPTGGFLHDARLTWSPALGNLVMTVGSGGNAWTYDGTDFTDTGSCIPEPSMVPCQNVSGFTTTYDPNLGKIVQYGGSTLSVVRWLGTSLFDGTFTLQTPANNPGYRDDQIARWAAWSDSCQGVIVFGGDDDASPATTTYVYKDVGGGTYDWRNTLQLNNTHPVATLGGSMVTGSDGQVLLFGGYSGALNYVDETWLFRCSSFIPQSYRRR